MSTPSTPPPAPRGPLARLSAAARGMPEGRARTALWLLTAYGALALVARAWTRAATWDFRAHDADPLDGTWRLALGWLASRGEWSYVDFHYPRGPLWQAVAALGATLAGGDAGWAHALTRLSFELLAMAALLFVVHRRVRSPRRRLAAGALAIVLSGAVEAATLRAALPLLVIDALVEREAPPRPWRDAAAAAGWTLISALVSFDRLYVALLGAGAVVAADLALGRAPRDGLLRAARFAACVLVGFAAASVVGLAVGADPFSVLVEQRRLVTDYAARMVTTWDARLPGWVVAVYVSAVVGVVVTARGAPPKARLSALLVAGVLPGLSFAIFRSDEEHLALAALPAVLALALVAIGATGSVRRRVAAGGLAGLALAAWIAVHPSRLVGHPGAFVELLAVTRGERAPDAAYRSESRSAVRWTRHHGDACVVATATLSHVHAMANVRGPTELPLRWTHARQRALADAIAAASCPRAVYATTTFLEPGNSWTLGPDFVEIARRYELERALGVSLLGLRQRAAPRAIDRTDLTPRATEAALSVPGVVRVPLGGVVEGTDLIEAPIEVDVASWRRLLGGAPRLEWRFAYRDRPVSGWAPMYGVSFGQPTRVQLSPDPTAVEWAWIAGRPPARRRRADALWLRARPRGRASPSEIPLRVGPIARLRLGRPPAPPSRACGPVDVAAALRDGRAFVRYASPRLGERSVELSANGVNDYVAEAWFDVRPCEGACLMVDAVVEPSRGGDGVELVATAFEPPLREELGRLVVPAGQAPRTLAVPLSDRANRDVLLGLAVYPRADARGDRVRLAAPRVGPCPRPTERLLSGALSTLSGSASIRGDDIRLGAGGASLELPVTTAGRTCFAVGVRVGVPRDAVLHVSLRGVDERPYVHRIPIEGGAGEIDAFEVIDRAAVDARLRLALSVPGEVGATLVRPRLEACPTDAP